MRKGQVSVFVIVGIIVLMFVGLASYIIDLQNEKTALENAIVQQSSTSKLAFQKYLEQCVRITGEKGLILLGLRGGKAELVEPYFNEGYVQTNFISPSDNLTLIFQNEMERYVSTKVPECIARYNFSDFREIEKPKVDVRINLDNLQIDFDWNAYLKNKEGEYKLDLVNIKYDFSLQNNLEIVNRIAKKTNHTKEADVIYLLLTGYNYSVVADKNGNIAYAMFDDRSIIADLPYMFTFAVQTGEQ